MGYLLLALLSFSVAVSAARIRYDDEQVLRCQLTNGSQASFYQFEVDHHLDVWAFHPDGRVDIRVRKEQQDAVKSHLQGCVIVIEDVELYVQEQEAIQINASIHAVDWFDAYHTYDEIVAWYETFGRENPSHVRYVSSIGKSYQGRDQPAIHIAGDIKQSAPKAGYAYFQCQIHAREWISGATCNYLASGILEAYEAGDLTWRSILDNLEIVIVPFVNPDGYVFSWTNNRLWRKNVKPTTVANCPGTDLNRNYNDHWGQGGSSSNPCDETYMGPSVSSEPEVQNTAGYFKQLQQKGIVLAAIDWHSYGQLVNRPYGWTPADCPHESILKPVGDRYAADILAFSGKIYISQKSYNLYITTGSASDWFYGDDATSGNSNIRAAGYTVELRPVNANPGFQLPPIEIKPTGAENLVAIKNFLNYWVVNGGLPNSS